MTTTVAENAILIGMGVFLAGMAGIGLLNLIDWAFKPSWPWGR